MKPPAALIEAVGDVTQAAFDLSGLWAAGDPLADAGALFDAFDRFRASYHRILFPETATAAGTVAEQGSPARFEAAIRIVDPGAFEPAIIARAILAACDELAHDRCSANDEAVRLMATQLAIVCRVSTDLKASSHLMFECTRRTFSL